MKKLMMFLLFAVLAIVPVYAQDMPNGTHYNLNIVGKNHCAGDDLTGSNRHVIQVLLNYADGSQDGQSFVTIDKRNKIFLAGGDDFQVLDGNACDGGGAKFMLPSNASVAYTVWARALGKPNGSATITTCAVYDPGTPTDPTDDVVYCSTADNVVTVTRTAGKPKWENVTRKLLYVCRDLDGDQACDNNELVPLFDPAYYLYFWDYDNNGLRLLQLRFYPVL